MTREEEIKAKLEKEDAVYLDCNDSYDTRAEDDILYLLARNEELQRRVDSALSIVNRRVESSTVRLTDGRVVHINCHDEWNLMSVLGGGGSGAVTP